MVVLDVRRRAPAVTMMILIMVRHELGLCSTGTIAVATGSCRAGSGRTHLHMGGSGRRRSSNHITNGGCSPAGGSIELFDRGCIRHL